MNMPVHIKRFLICSQAWTSLEELDISGFELDQDFDWDYSIGIEDLSSLTKIKTPKYLKRGDIRLPELPGYPWYEEEDDDKESTYIYLPTAG